MIDGGERKTEYGGLDWISMGGLEFGSGLFRLSLPLFCF